MLQRLGFLMDFVPAIAKHPEKKGFQKTMVAHELHRDPPTRLGQMDSPIRSSFHQALLRKLLEHSGNRGWPYPDSFRQELGRGATRPVIEKKNLLQVILLGVAQARRVSAARAFFCTFSHGRQKVSLS